MLRNLIKDSMVADCVFTTEKCRLWKVMALCRNIGQEIFSRSSPLFMPLLMNEDFFEPLVDYADIILE